MRFLLITAGFWISSPLAAIAAAEGGHHALPLDAQRLNEVLPFTNSMVMVWIAVGLIVLFCRMATRKMALVPAGIQNFAEIGRAHV